jgi:hypothetical protein
MHAISLHLVLHTFAATLMSWELNFNIHEPNRALLGLMSRQSCCEHKVVMCPMGRVVVSNCQEIIKALVEFGD